MSHSNGNSDAQSARKPRKNKSQPDVALTRAQRAKNAAKKEKLVEMRAKNDVREWMFTPPRGLGAGTTHGNDRFNRYTSSSDEVFDELADQEDTPTTSAPANANPIPKVPDSTAVSHAQADSGQSDAQPGPSNAPAQISSSVSSCDESEAANAQQPPRRRNRRARRNRRRTRPSYAYERPPVLACDPHDFEEVISNHLDPVFRYAGIELAATQSDTSQDDQGNRVVEKPKKKKKGGKKN